MLNLGQGLQQNMKLAQSGPNFMNKDPRGMQGQLTRGAPTYSGLPSAPGAGRPVGSLQGQAPMPFAIQREGGGPAIGPGNAQNALQQFLQTIGRGVPGLPTAKTTVPQIAPEHQQRTQQYNHSMAARDLLKQRQG